MLRRVKQHAIPLLIISLVLGLATVGFLLIPSRLSGVQLPIQITLGGPTAPAPSEAAPAVDSTPHAANGSEPEHVEGLLYDIGRTVVNLADPGGYRYLKVGIVLEVLPADVEFYTLSGEERELAENRTLEALDKQRPIIEDVVTVKLSGKTFEEVFAIAGKEQLKQELRDDLNARLSVGRVRDIYFTEFVIQ